MVRCATSAVDCIFVLCRSAMLTLLFLSFCPFFPPGTAGKSSLVRQTSPDTCGHTQGNNPTGTVHLSYCQCLNSSSLCKALLFLHVCDRLNQHTIKLFFLGMPRNASVLFITRRKNSVGLYNLRSNNTREALTGC